jgi:hypothetical protein
MTRGAKATKRDVQLERRKPMRDFKWLGRVLLVGTAALVAVPGLAGGATYRYHNWCYVVKTADRSGAGTDANLRLQIDGSKLYHSEDTPGFSLTQLMTGNAFEAGDVDQGIRRAMDHGDIWRIQLESDGKYAGADWLPQWVCISRDGCAACSPDVIERFGNAGDGGYLCRVNQWLKKGKSGWIRCVPGEDARW